jgi:hypothetical protein
MALAHVRRPVYRGRALQLAGRLACVTLACGIAALGRPLRAEVVLQLAPELGGGVTDNVNATTAGNQHEADGFTRFAGSLRLRYQGARADHALGYVFSFTRFLQGQGTDTISNDLGWASSFKLTAVTNLRVEGGATLSRMSSIAAADPYATAPVSAVPGGSTLFLASRLSQGLSYTPTPRTSYNETLSFAQVHYLDAPANANLSGGTFVSADLRGSWLVRRERVGLDLVASDSIAPDDPMRGTFGSGHTFLTSLLIDWTHELSPTWAVGVGGGPSMMFKWGGPGVIAPAAFLSANYRRVPWFAGVTASQVPSANIYVGQATISDQILARAALPLNRRETLLVAGFGGYVYARVVDSTFQLTRAYDQVTGGVSLALRFSQFPGVCALNYTVLSQHGSSTLGNQIPDLARQSVFLSVSGTFSWGPGTPPLFGGPL